MYRSEVREFANELIDEFLGSLNEEWKFQWDNGTKRAGCCDYRKREIRLSRKLFEKMSDEFIRDTLLHEIAHALTPGDHHGEIWKSAAQMIGCTRIERCHNLDTNDGAKYSATCECKTHYWHRKPKYFTYTCQKCSSQLVPTKQEEK